MMSDEGMGGGSEEQLPVVTLSQTLGAECGCFLTRGTPPFAPFLSFP